MEKDKFVKANCGLFLGNMVNALGVPKDNPNCAVWIYDKDPYGRKTTGVICSKCGFATNIKSLGKAAFCPECGRKMTERI